MYNLPMKGIEFLGASLKTVREFPALAKKEAGYQLDRVQRGWIQRTGSP